MLKCDYRRLSGDVTCLDRPEKLPVSLSQKRGANQPNLGQSSINNSSKKITDITTFL